METEKIFAYFRRSMGKLLFFCSSVGPETNKTNVDFHGDRKNPCPLSPLPIEKSTFVGSFFGPEITIGGKLPSVVIGKRDRAL